MFGRIREIVGYPLIKIPLVGTSGGVACTYTPVLKDIAKHFVYGSGSLRPDWFSFETEHPLKTIFVTGLVISLFYALYQRHGLKERKIEVREKAHHALLELRDNLEQDSLRFGEEFEEINRGLEDCLEE